MYFLFSVVAVNSVEVGSFGSLIFLNHFISVITSLTSLFLMMKMGSATVKDRKKLS